jgi:tetratricopeptide (TPR) repeat protein
MKKIFLPYLLLFNICFSFSQEIKNTFYSPPNGIKLNDTLFIDQTANDFYQLGLKQLDSIEITGDANKYTEKALEYFNKSIKVDSNFAKVYYELGCNEYRVGNYAKAFFFINKSLHKDSTLLESYYCKAAMNLEIGEVENADKILLAIIKKDSCISEIASLII